MKTLVNILLVEDSEDDAALMLRALGRGGFDVQHERVASAAAMQAALARPGWDAVISDYNLPGFTGLDALEIVKASGLDLPFILVSGTVGEETAVQAMKQGAGDYVMKKHLALLAPALERGLKEATNRAGQRQAQEEQHVTQRLLDNIVENIPTAVHLKSVADGYRVVLWNKAAEAVYGVPRQDALGHNVHDLWPKDDADRFHAADLELIASGRMQDFPNRSAQTKDRGEIRVHIRKVALFDAGGKATHLLAITDDITAQLADQTRLRESEARFRSLTELSSDWYWEQDEEYRFVDFSGGESVTGWGPDQRKALGLRRWELPGASPVSGNWDEHKALVEARKPYRNFEYTHTRLDGTRQYLDASGEPVFDASGRFTGYRGVASNITERKRAELELQRFAMAMDKSVDSIYLTDPATMRFVYLNNTACERLGHARERLLQLGPQDVLALPREEISRGYDAVIAAGAPGLRLESRFTRSDGSEGWTELHRHALSIGGGTLIVTIGRDITERKQMEREAQAKAAVTQLLEALARTVNEAAGPEDAMQRCLERICEHGRWALGRITYLADETPGSSPHLVVWHDGPDQERFARFEQDYDAISLNDKQGRFVGRMLREQGPVWIADISGMQAPRLLAAARSGLHSGFIFPVIVRDKVAAFLEFFADEVRAPDQLLLGSIGSVGAQLARLFEREEAAATLKASEAWLRTVLQAQPECVSVIGADGSLIDMNRAGLDMLEAQSLEQVRERGTSSFVVHEQRARLAAHHEQTLAGKPSKLEFEVIGLRGTRRWMESHATPVDLPGAGGKAVLSVTRDITERKHAEEHVAYLSHYDALTGLPNRTLFADRLGLALARGKRQNEVVGIMLFNLDRFKYVNEGLGQEGGDELLRQVALRLKETLRDVDTIARLGGDEFAILAEDLSASADVNAVADKLLEAFALPFVVKGVEVVAVPSIGITIHPNGGDDPATLMEHAETAMQRVKREGGGGYRVYEAEPAQQGNQRLDTETRLRRAQERGELELHYQPKVDLLSGAITGVEALLRWNSPELGPISPARFIPIAEDSGLIVPIGDWVLRSACAQMRRWHDLGHNIGVAVNLSPRQFRQKDLVSSVAQALQQSGLAPHYLELEITEGAAMANAEQAIGVLGELHALGVRLSVDDFGTGYSSLSYLKRFPLDTLKIDRSFVMDLGSDANSDAIVRATIALAQSLHLKVVAEGVETETQRDFLARAVCDEMQGYLFSKPLPAAALLALLEKHAPAAQKHAQAQSVR